MTAPRAWLSCAARSRDPAAARGGGPVKKSLIASLAAFVALVAAGTALVPSAATATAQAPALAPTAAKEPKRLVRFSLEKVSSTLALTSPSRRLLRARGPALSPSAGERENRSASQ